MMIMIMTESIVGQLVRVFSVHASTVHVQKHTVESNNIPNVAGKNRILFNTVHQLRLAIVDGHTTKVREPELRRLLDLRQYSCGHMPLTASFLKALRCAQYSFLWFTRLMAFTVPL